MKEYLYKARTNTGELAEGTIEAETEQSASNLLVSKSLSPIDIKENSNVSKSIPFLDKVRIKDKVFFIRQLATMTKAGMPISQSLTNILEQTSSKPVKKMLEQIIRDIEAGSSLSDSFGTFDDVFSATDINILAAGEASGKLDEVLGGMADQIDKNYKMMKKIKNMFIYPAFLMIVVVVVVVVMLVFVLPQMEELYKSFNGAKLPLPTRMLIGMSHIMINFWWLFIIFFVSIFVGFRFAIKNSEPMRRSWHKSKLYVPLLGQFLKMSYMAIFTRTLSSLVSSGVPILDSLKIVGDAMPNILYREGIHATREDVKQGELLSESLRKNDIFPVMVPEMIGVGESTGEIDSMLKNLAEYYSDEIDNWTTSFKSLLEPIIIVVMGVIVGGIIVSIMLPIYSLGNIIGAK